MELIRLLSSLYLRNQSNGELDKFSKITDLGRNTCMRHVFIQQTHHACLPCASCVSLCPAAPMAGPILRFGQIRLPSVLEHSYFWSCILLPEKFFYFFVLILSFLQDSSGIALHEASFLCFGRWLLLQALAYDCRSVLWNLIKFCWVLIFKLPQCVYQQTTNCLLAGIISHVP